MTCLNCGERHVAMQNTCVLPVLAALIAQRGNFTESEALTLVQQVDPDALWQDLGPIIDRLEDGKYA